MIQRPIGIVLSVALALLVAGAPAEAARKRKPAAPKKPAAATAEASKAKPGTLTAQTAAGFAKLALACIDRPYPYKPDRVLDQAAAVREPRLDHPVFFGCFDWHSAVHGHWMLARLARLYPAEPFAAQARDVLRAHITPDAVRGEVAFISGKPQALFERPYGWAWALRLGQELRAWDDPAAVELARTFAPLEQALVARLKEYLPKLPHPVRAGTHPNTAFAMALAYDYGRAAHDDKLVDLVARRAREFYGEDRYCPLEYEPGGEDFFPPCLLEADLMRRVLGQAEFSGWLDGLLPGLRSGELGPLGEPAVVTDPADGRIVHLDGLNLARAWALRGVASALAAGDPRRKPLLDAADAHEKAGLARVASGNYEGEHWLASFATYLTTQAWTGK